MFELQRPQKRTGIAVYLAETRVGAVCNADAAVRADGRLDSLGRQVAHVVKVVGVGVDPLVPGLVVSQHLQGHRKGEKGEDAQRVRGSTEGS